MSEKTPLTVAAAYQPELMMMMVRSGQLDEILPDMRRWIAQREDVLATQRISNLQIGDQIRISATVRPQLLAHVRCQVVSFEGSDKVKVRLMQTASSKWREGNVITLPKSIVGDKI